MTTIISTMTIMPLALGTWEIIAIIAVILLLFGGKKIPELMRGLGKGVKEFKSGMKDAEDAIRGDIKDETKNADDKVFDPDKIERTK